MVNWFLLFFFHLHLCHIWNQRLCCKFPDSHQPIGHLVLLCCKYKIKLCINTFLNLYFQGATFQCITGGIEFLRVWIGPLPTPICFVYLTTKGGIATAFVFLMLGVFVMKYLFICKWKRVRQLEDDFIATITLMTAVLIGFGFQLFKTMGPGRISNHYVSFVFECI